MGGLSLTTLLYKSSKKSLSNTHWKYYQTVIRTPHDWSQGKTAQIILRAYRGYSYTSEISFDDIFVRPGKCPWKWPIDATLPPTTISTTKGFN